MLTSADMKRFLRLIALLILLSPTVLPLAEAQSNSHGQGRTDLRVLFEVSLLDPLVIDFATAPALPVDLQGPVQRAMEAARPSLPATNRFSVTALRGSGGWMQVILVPTVVVETGWEAGLDAGEVVEVLAHLDETGEWTAGVRGTPDFLKLAREVPEDFIDLSPPLDDPASQPEEIEYLFPWTSGQSWYKVGIDGGWHKGWTNNSLDFQPVRRVNPSVDNAVLAAAPGRLTRICGGPGTSDPWQSTLKIDHTDGSTFYLHLDASSIREDLLGRDVSRGQFLGLLYSGTQGAGGGYQYYTMCGWGTAIHLHFELPRRDMTLNGFYANAIASSPFATTYVSSNLRVDNSAAPLSLILRLPVIMRNRQ